MGTLELAHFIGSGVGLLRRESGAEPFYSLIGIDEACAKQNPVTSCFKKLSADDALTQWRWISDGSYPAALSSIPSSVLGRYPVWEKPNTPSQFIRTAQDFPNRIFYRAIDRLACKFIECSSLNPADLPLDLSDWTVIAFSDTRYAFRNGGMFPEVVQAAQSSQGMTPVLRLALLAGVAFFALGGASDSDAASVIANSSNRTAKQSLTEWVNAYGIPVEICEIWMAGLSEGECAALMAMGEDDRMSALLQRHLAHLGFSGQFGKGLSDHLRANVYDVDLFARAEFAGDSSFRNNELKKRLLQLEVPAPLDDVAEWINDLKDREVLDLFLMEPRARIEWLIEWRIAQLGIGESSDPLDILRAKMLRMGLTTERDSADWIALLTTQEAQSAFTLEGMDLWRALVSARFKNMGLSEADVKALIGRMEQHIGNRPFPLLSAYSFHRSLIERMGNMLADPYIWETPLSDSDPEALPSRFLKAMNRLIEKSGPESPISVALENSLRAHTSPSAMNTFLEHLKARHALGLLKDELMALEHFLEKILNSSKKS